MTILVRTRAASVRVYITQVLWAVAFGLKLPCDTTWFDISVSIDRTAAG